MEVPDSILLLMRRAISFLDHDGGLILKVKQVVVEEQLAWIFL